MNKMSQIKKYNFKRISENRVSKILALFSQLRNLTNLSFYEYTNEEILRMFILIDDESKKTREKLLEANNRKGSFKNQKLKDKKTKRVTNETTFDH